MSESTSKAVGVIKSLVSLVGVTVGIIISVIGAIMFLESIFKLYVFDVQEGRYSNYTYRCEQYDIDSIEARRLVGMDFGPAIQVKTPSTKKIAKLTEAEKKKLREQYTKCKKEAKEEAHKSFVNGEKMDIATGIAFILVGLPLLYFYQRKRKDRK